jgi:hypothetical protein
MLLIKAEEDRAGKYEKVWYSNKPLDTRCTGTGGAPDWMKDLKVQMSIIN